MIKIPFDLFKDFDAYMAHMTKPKVEHETVASVGIDKILGALNSARLNLNSKPDMATPK